MRKLYFAGGSLVQLGWDAVTHGRLFMTMLGSLFVIGDLLIMGGTTLVGGILLSSAWGNGKTRAKDFSFYLPIFMAVYLVVFTFLSLNGYLHHSMYDDDPFESSQAD